MSEFHVGQRVVCVDIAGDDPECPLGLIFPGQTGLVGEVVEMKDGEIGLVLEGRIHPDWADPASCFRPLRPNETTAHESWQEMLTLPSFSEEEMECIREIDRIVAENSRGQ